MRDDEVARSWRRLRAAGAWAAFGDGAVTVALPLLAAETTRDPVSVAIVVAALHLPWVLAAVFGPVLTLRADRRTVMGGLDTLRTVAFGWLGFQALLGDVPIATIAVVAAVAGVAVALVDEAEQETADVVAGGQPPVQARGRLAVPEVVSDGFLGIPAGAAAFAVVPGAPFLVAAAAYTFAALLALTVEHGPEVTTGPAPDGTPTPGAVARAAASADVLAGGALAAVVGLAGSAVAGPLVLIGLDELTLGAGGIGVLYTVLAAASLAGGVLASDLAGRAAPLTSLGGSLVLGAGGYAVAATVDGTVPVLAGLATGTAFSVGAVMLARQQRRDGVLAGRAHHAMTWAVIPAGAVIGGVVAEAWGLRAPIALAAAGLLAAIPLVPLTVRPDLVGRRPDTRALAKIG